MTVTSVTGAPRVTIGVPVYNGARHIVSRLDNICSQSLPGIQIVVSDNHSDDGTYESLLRYERVGHDIKLIRQSKNVGAHRNFQAVINESTTEYCMIAAADDWMEEDFVERCVVFLDSHRDYVLAIPGFESRGRMTGTLLKAAPTFDTNVFETDNVEERVRYFALLPSASHKSNYLMGIWRTDALKCVYARFADLEDRFVYQGLDMAMLSYALTLGKFGYLPGLGFIKYNPRVPYGSFPSRLLERVDRVFRFERARRKRARQRDANRAYLWLMERALADSGLNAQFRESLLTELRTGLAIDDR